MEPLHENLSLLDVRQPRKRWKRIRGVGGNWSLCHFKYERLCYLCGMLGHFERFCDKLFMMGEEGAKSEWDQGFELRRERS